MKRFLSMGLCLLGAVCGMWAQSGQEDYSFLTWAPEGSGAEYVSSLSEETVTVSSGASGCYVEQATFAGHELNGRFAFASADNVTLTADGGLLVKNNAGKKNTTIAVLGLHEGDKVTIEYSSSNEIQLTSGNAFYEKEDGTTVSFTKVGKNNANKLGKNSDGAHGGTSYTLTMTADGSLDLLSATTAGSISLWSVTISTPTTRAAFVFNSGYPGYDNEANHFLLNFVKTYTDALEGIDLVDVDLAESVVSAESLRDYELVILSSAIAEDEPQAGALRGAVGYVPMLNLSSNLYGIWGYGAQTSGGTHVLKVLQPEHELFASHDFGIEIAEDSTMAFFEEGADVVGYRAEGEYFAADEVLATAGGVNAIHIHNAGRNAYIMLPLMTEWNDYLKEFVGDMLSNVISYLKHSARTVVKTAMPVAELTYADGSTQVALNCATKGGLTWIYYTTDGTEPTEESTLYDGPIVITAEGQVVKAVARVDGYDLSEVMTTEPVDIRQQVERPEISVAVRKTGSATVELTCGTPGATIYYNYAGSEDVKESAAYTGPITLAGHVTLTALAAKEGMVNSELVSELVRVEGERVRIDTLAWMNSHDVAYGSGDIVKQYNYWTTEKVDSVGTPQTYDDGTPVLDENNEQAMEWTYTYAHADSLTYKDFGNGWAVGSYGQRINNQVNNGTGNVGTGEYGPATVDDWGFSRGAMSFLVCKTAADPASAWIQTTVKHQAPFDIVIWLTGQQAEGLRNEVELSVSEDSINWTVVDTVNTTYLKNVQKHVRSYEGTGEVFLKARSVNRDNTTQQKTLVFDILLLNRGALSEAFENSDPTGIVDEWREASGERVVSRRYYNMNGVESGHLLRGINIVKETCENGAVRTRKVIVK